MGASSRRTRGCGLAAAAASPACCRCACKGVGLSRPCLWRAPGQLSGADWRLRRGGGGGKGGSGASHTWPLQRRQSWGMTAC